MSSQMGEENKGGRKMKLEKSICVKCEKDRNKHSKLLWALHNQTELCGFCQKNGIEHSEKLWDMHQLTVEQGQYCSEHNKRRKAISNYNWICKRRNCESMQNCRNASI